MATTPPSSSSEFHLCEGERSPEDLARDVETWRPYLGNRILDIGCGEGHLVSALARAGYAAEGVDATPDLVARARARGVTVTQSDALDFIRTDGFRFDTFLMIDFVEHIPFDQTAAILQALPVGASCIIQTPNTNSIIGHQFYLQVPGHVTPLSAAVLEKMVARAGLTVKTTGTRWGGLPWTGLRRRVTLFALEKIFGRVLLPLFVQGANYYMVAEKSPSRS
jgi:2-polyprenyl-3-methyl-5-hydroxy-6-metoxy-1,4-benzoquinol methylase